MSNITQAQYESLLRLYNESQEHIALLEKDILEVKKEKFDLRILHNNFKAKHEEIMDNLNSKYYYIDFNKIKKDITLFFGQKFLKDCGYKNIDTKIFKKRTSGWDSEFVINEAEFTNVYDMFKQLSDSVELYKSTLDEDFKQYKETYRERIHGELQDLTAKKEQILEEIKTLENKKSLKSIWEILGLTK